jgi:hypothetical protein
MRDYPVEDDGTVVGVVVRVTPTKVTGNVA